MTARAALFAHSLESQGTCSSVDTCPVTHSQNKPPTRVSIPPFTLGSSSWHSGIREPWKWIPSSGSRIDALYTNPFVPLMTLDPMSTVIQPTIVLSCCCLMVLTPSCSSGIRSANMSFKFVKKALAGKNKTGCILGSNESHDRRTRGSGRERAEGGERVAAGMGAGCCARHPAYAYGCTRFLSSPVTHN